MRHSVRETVFTVLVLLFQILFFVLFITLTDYGDYGFPKWITNVSYTLNSSLFTSLSDSSLESISSTDSISPSTATSSIASVTITGSTASSPITTTAGTTSSTPTGSSSTVTSTTTTSPSTATASSSTTTSTTGMPIRAYDDELVIRQIKQANPRFLLPPGSRVPSVPSDPLKAPFYSMLPINVMIFAGLGLLFSSIRCSSFGGLGLVFFLACFAFEWAALVIPWLLQAATKVHKPEDIYYNITTLIDILYAVFSMIVAFGALVGRTSKIQLLVVMICGVVLYGVNRMVITQYLVTLDLGGSMSVFAFGSFYGLAISWVINAFYKSDKLCQPSRSCYLYSGYFENFLSLFGTVIIFVHWPYYCAYLIPVTMEMYVRAIVNTYFTMVTCVVTVYALTTAITKSRRIDIGHIQKATIAGGVAVASVAPLLIKIWGAVLLGFLTGFFSVLFLNYAQKYLKKAYIYDTCAVFSTFAIPGIIGGIASAVMAALAVSPLDYTLNELFILYPAVTGPNGVGAPRSDTAQGGYQFASLIVSIGMGIVGGLIVGILVRYLGPLEEDETYSDDTMFTYQYNVGSPCQNNGKTDKGCTISKD